MLIADDDPVLRRLLPLQIGAKDFEFNTAAGAVRDHSSDVRITAATNKNLPEEVRAENFRTDFFYYAKMILTS